MKAKLTAIVLALCATFALAATSACADESVAGTSWCITEQTDNITDAVSYLIATIAKESEEPEIPCPVCHPNANKSTQSGGFGKGK